jgi:predicted DNA-binding ribbon-helix-helix protein
MKSLIMKRPVAVAGRKTSVSVEDAFWNSLKEIGARRNMTLSALVTAIDAEHHHSNLSSAIRLFILDFYREQFAGGHTRATTLDRSATEGFRASPAVQLNEQQAF